jgi:hypothetical protein
MDAVARGPLRAAIADGCDIEVIQGSVQRSTKRWLHLSAVGTIMATSRCGFGVRLSFLEFPVQVSRGEPNEQ